MTEFCTACEDVWAAMDAVPEDQRSTCECASGHGWFWQPAITRTGFTGSLCWAGRWMRSRA